MSIKRKLQNLLPSYRSKEAIMDELYNIHNKIDKLDKSIKDLDVKNEYLFYCLQHLDGETDLETKRRVYLNMPKASGRIRDFQIVANYILRRVKKICDENNIEFSLDAGTLIGAVRHKGFIPWDDDVDISLMHDDYYRLEEIINQDEELIMKRCYCYLGNGTQASYITKIKLKASELFFIDVFPRNLYYVPPEHYEDAWKEILTMEKNFKNELYDLYNYFGFEHIQLDTKPRECIKLDKVVEELERKYQKAFYDNNNKKQGNQYCCLSVENNHNAFIKHKLYPAYVFLPIRKNACEFEGGSYSLFNDYNEWLEVWYGDYWSLPREISQVHSLELDSFSPEDIKIVKDIKQKIADR